MLAWFFVLFLAPIVEMYLLIRVGGYLGALPTVALVVLTAVAGALLVRHQGLATLTRGMSRLESGQVPANEMVEAMLLAVAGVMLMVPGFVTDAIGVVLLVPPVRAAIARRVLARVVVGPAPGSSRSGDRSHGASGSHSAGRSHGASGSRQPDVIEGEFESRIEPDDDADDRDRLP